MIRLKTFGTPMLRRDDAPVEPAAAQRRRLALLALLAVAGDEGISRDRLVAHLWPEAGDEQARHTLAQMLYLLRRDFPGADIVLGTSDLRLGADAIETDVACFRTALASGDIDRAAALYGGPFLDGFYLSNAPEFERWVETERARFAGQARAAFEGAARKAAARGDVHRAADWWRRIAAVDPLDAHAAVGLMEALAATGDRAGALRLARVHETLMRAELAAPPDAAVAALARRLRAIEPPGTAEAVVTTAPPPVPEVPAEVAARDETMGDPAAAAATARSRRHARLIPRGGILVAAAVVLVAALGAATVLNRRPVASTAPTFAIGAVRDYGGADTSGIARALTDMLATNLARVPELRVVSNARIYELIGAARSSGARDPTAQISTAARHAGATEIVEGTMYQLRPGELRFDIRRVDVASGAIRKAYSVEGADAFELVDRATSELAADLGATPPGALHVADVTTRSLVAYRFYEEGLRAYYQQNDVQGARRLFLAALGEDSTFAMAAFYAAEAERGLGMAMLDRYVHAARLADRATDRERLLVRGTAALWTGEPAGLAVAETLATHYPAEADGHYLLGQELIFSGDFLGALPHLRRVVEMDSLGLRGTTPRCLACDALQAMATAYWLADSLPAAERVARDWTRARPDVTLPWRTLSGMLLMAGRYAEALTAERTAARVAPGTTNPLLDVYVAMRTGDFAAADSVLRLQYRDEPTSEAGWLLTLSLRYQGRLHDALAVAREAAARASHGVRPAPPGMADAIVLFDMGRYGEAASDYAAFAARANYRPEYRARNARDRAWMLTHEATARAAAGDTATLAALADSVLRLGTLSGYGRDQRLHHYVRGLLLRARGDLPAAADELRRGLFSLTDGYTRNNYELARTLLALHRPAEAIAVLQPAFRGSLQASNTYITLTELHELLAEAFDAAAQPDSAAIHYRYVVRAWARADAQFRPRWERARLRLAALQGRG